MKSPPPGYQRFLAELKRRRVFRVIAAYGAVAFAVIEAADVVLPRMALPDWTVTLVVWLALLGFPVAVALSWAFDLTSKGVQRTVEVSPAELTRIINAPATKRWPAGLLALAGVMALLAGAWYAGRHSSPNGEAGPDRGSASPSIAVLPLTDMSPDGDQEEFALEEGDEEYRVKGNALSLHDLGREAEYEAMLGELSDGWGSQCPSEVAQVHAWTGDTDAAFEWLDKAVAQNEAGLTVQFLIPFYAALHRDPRWNRFRERTGTSAEQLAAIRFDTKVPR